MYLQTIFASNWQIPSNLRNLLWWKRFRLNLQKNFGDHVCAFYAGKQNLNIYENGYERLSPIKFCTTWLVPQNSRVNLPLFYETEGINLPLFCEAEGINLPFFRKQKGKNLPLFYETGGYKSSLVFGNRGGYKSPLVLRNRRV